MKAIECCGKPHATRFCPDCGKSLRGNSDLEELLIHVRGTAKRSRAPLISGRSHGENYLEQQRAVAEKWERWGNALALAISEQNKE
jgi:hypothetical protein